MEQKLFIPKKIKVGFQNRQDTFTGKLAYVIYFDEKGVLRKEKSWTGWCDDKIPSFEFDNDPRNGYILNKGIQRYSDWGSGRSVIRVHDPREFEFEISIDNLIGILMHSDVTKRDIQEECVFAWAGSELVLLPINSAAYQSSVEYTNKQDQKVSTKDLVKGYQYQQKKNDDVWTYLGFFPWWEWVYDREGYTNVHTNKGKKHIFYHTVKDWRSAEPRVEFSFPSVSTFSHAVTNEVDPDYSTRVDDFFKTGNSQKIVEVRTSNKFELKKNVSSYYRFPQVYMIENGKTHKVHSSGYDYKDAVTLQYVSYSAHTFVDTIDEKGQYTRKYEVFDGSCGGYGYYSRSYQTKQNSGMERRLQDSLRVYSSEHHRSDITLDDQVEFLTKLGFGELYFVLENGNEFQQEI